MGTADKRRECNSNQLLQPTAVAFIHVYEVHFGKDKRGVDLISDSLPFGRVWHDWPEAVAKQLAMRDSTAAHMMP